MLLYLTCSDTSCVVPQPSSHFAKNSSPRNGLSGFFSEPSFSFLLLYCCFRVLKNHLRTSRARLAGSFSDAGATKSEGCSLQYEENSVKDVVLRMKGGAVRDERSPLNEAIDYYTGKHGQHPVGDHPDAACQTNEALRCRVVP